jgi:calcineurin-like phosphoesterase family protein
MNSWLTSDLHAGHAGISRFRKIPDGLTNEEWLEREWGKHIGKRDIVRCLGDNVFTPEMIEWLKGLPGTKHGIGGNHDDLPAHLYLECFATYRGMDRYKGVWLTHSPMHPAELRGRFNVHGHVHYQSIDDWRYINVCCDNLWENIGRPFITLDELRATMELRKISRKVEFAL